MGKLLAKIRNPKSELLSFPNSCLGTLLAETPVSDRGETGVSRTDVPKQEFGNENEKGIRNPNLRFRISEFGFSGLCLFRLEETQVLELAVEDGVAVHAEPVVQERGVHLAEVGVVFQVAGVEVLQAGVVADDAARQRRAGDEQARPGPAAGALAGVLLGAAAEFRQRPHPHALGVLGLLHGGAEPSVAVAD